MTDKELIQDAIDTSIHQMMGIYVTLNDSTTVQQITDLLWNEFEIEPNHDLPHAVCFIAHDNVQDLPHYITIYPAN